MCVSVSESLDFTISIRTDVDFNIDIFRSNFVTSVADQAVFHSEPLLAMQLARSPKLSLLKTISDPGSINRSLKEIDAIIQSMSYVGKVKKFYVSS